MSAAHSILTQGDIDPDYRAHHEEAQKVIVSYGWCPECGMWTSDGGFGITDESACDHCNGPIDETILYNPTPEMEKGFLMQRYE